MRRIDRACRVGLAVSAVLLFGGQSLPAGPPEPGPSSPGAVALPAPSGPSAAPPTTRPSRATPARPARLGVGAGAAGLAQVATILAAGDIATCKHADDEATARLLERLSGTIVAVGDLAYPEGSAAAFRKCYGPSWGSFAARTRPVIGNHEYLGSVAAYLEYFDGRGPMPGRTWYAFDVGPWRAYVLDSDCTESGGCGVRSPEGRWLAADLAANPRTCSIAFMHHPRFSTGHHGNDVALVPLWDILYRAHVDVVVSGHDHDYERFALLTPEGRRAPDRGIREFVVGTGGAPLRSFPRRAAPATQVRNSTTHGILQLRLDGHGYAWRFVPVAGRSFTDSGEGLCH
jgi:acid phosphatase type 7